MSQRNKDWKQPQQHCKTSHGVNAVNSYVTNSRQYQDTNKSMRIVMFLVCYKRLGASATK